MPRIDAPTVAEHRARQRAALLAAARDLLLETGAAPSLAEVGRRAGLARSSVYEYVRNKEELLAAVVADVVPQWTERLTAAVAAETTPGGRVWAYVRSNVEFFTGSEQAVARALGAVVDPAVLMPNLQEFHLALQEPLRQALTDLGEGQVEAAANLIDAMILAATADLRSGTTPVTAAQSGDALDLLRRFLAGYLGLHR